MILLGKRLKELRKSKNLTQEQLGSLLNVTKVSICCYEKGTRIPSLDTLVDIANLFKVDLDYLVGNDSYIVSDEDKEYGMSVSKEEINFLKELRKHTDIYNKIINNPTRMLELIEKKVR